MRTAIGAACFAFVAASLEARAEVPTITVQAQIVHVDVVVTDKHGKGVAGLGPGDFVLLEDGRAVEVVGFRAPNSGATQARGGPPGQPAADAPPAPSRGAAAAAESPVVVVYVDNANLTTAGRRRLLAGVRSFLDSHPAVGRLLVISAGEHQTRALSPVTTRRDEVVAALRAAEEGSAQGQQSVSDERATLEMVKDVIDSTPSEPRPPLPPKEPCEAAMPVLQDIVSAHARARQQQIQRAIDRLGETVAALGALPGPKVLLYLSQGLDQRPGIHLFHQLGDICPAALYRDASSLLAPMNEIDLSTVLRALAARAGAARVTIYPLDGGGLSTHSVADVSYADRRYVPSVQTDTIRATNLQAGEWILAEETGGVPVVNANNPAPALGQLALEIAGSYALGFTPAREPDGRTHEIRVELRRKGLRVRHRRSYVHGSAAEAMVGRSLAALVFGLEEDTLGARVEAELSRSSAGAAAGRVASVRISVPLAALESMPGPGGPRARLRIVLAVGAAEASAERPVDIRQKWVEMALPPASADREINARRELVVTVPLGPRAQEIAVGVEDVASRRVTFRRVGLTVE